MSSVDGKQGDVRITDPMGASERFPASEGDEVVAEVGPSTEEAAWVDSGVTSLFPGAVLLFASTAAKRASNARQ